MSTMVKAKGDFAQVPAGTHPAWCYGVIDIGHQESVYQGKANTRQQVILLFEIPGETVIINGDKAPMIMSAFYTASISKKARLREDLESWRGKAFTAEEMNGFDLKNVVGKSCTLSVFHNENEKARIKGIGAAMKGVTIPSMHNDPLWFDIDVHGIHSEEYERVPDWIKEIIGRRVDPDTESPVPLGVVEEFVDDDIPF